MKSRSFTARQERAEARSCQSARGSRARRRVTTCLASIISHAPRRRITAPSADATSPAARSTVAFAPTGSASAEFTSTDVQRPEAPRRRERLAEEVGLSVRETAAYRGARRRRDQRVARIHIEGAVQRTVITEVVEGRIDHMTDAPPINIVHRAHEGAPFS